MTVVSNALKASRSQLYVRMKTPPTCANEDPTDQEMGPTAAA